MKNRKFIYWPNRHFPPITIIFKLSHKQTYDFTLKGAIICSYITALFKLPDTSGEYILYLFGWGMGIILTIAGLHLLAWIYVAAKGDSP